MQWQFDGEIFQWRGPAPFYFVATPDDVDAYLHDNIGELSYGWGCIPATVQVGATQETTALIPKDGVYLVPLKVRLRRAEQVEDGDVVQVRLVVAEP